jgi:hypothetical protein
MVNDKTPMPVNQRADRPLPKREREREESSPPASATAPASQRQTAGRPPLFRQ